MKLSQLFSGDTHAENVVRPQPPSPAQAAYMSRQIRSLVPGQTIMGEVLSREGGEVQIRLSEDLVLNARVDRNMNIEVGKSMTFEVKNNGSSLTLSPLFTNVSTDMNVLKALDMAGLPVNGTSVAMTEQLMQAGMSVSKNMLQQIFRELNSFPGGEIADVISLHKLQLPVNEANLGQMAAYRNMEHQLMAGMEEVLEALPEVFDSLTAEGDMAGAMRLYGEILALVQESGEPEMPGQGAVPEELPAAGTGQQSPELSGILDRAASGARGESVLAEEAGAEGQADMFPLTELQKVHGPGQTAAGGEAAARTDGTGLPETVRAAMAEEAVRILDGLGLSGQEAAQLRSLLSGFGGGQTGAREFLSGLGMLAHGARTSEGAMAALERLFSGQGFRELLTGQFKNFWTLSAQEVAVPGKVEEMYRRLDRQLKGLGQALESAGHADTAAFRAISSLSQNVDFLHQVNQMYAYVQLPLRLQQGDAHGELYVYTNKKKLTSRQGAISALLHLDMEHLGPVDVYVTLQSSKVSTKFYLRDEDMIDFLSEHMSLLTQRLEKRGYDCSCSLTVKEKDGGEAAGGGLAPLLGQERGAVISQYAFDVRT